jgi:hypothetical protein
MNMKMTVFWYVAPYSLVDIDQHLISEELNASIIRVMSGATCRRVGVDIGEGCKRHSSGWTNGRREN